MPRRPVGASAARALALAIGTNDVEVRATWKQSNGAPDVTHTFSTLSDAGQESADSRIYGGIHYRFDNVAGQTAGKAVADYVFANFMTPRSLREYPGGLKFRVSEGIKRGLLTTRQVEGDALTGRYGPRILQTEGRRIVTLHAACPEP